MKKLSLAQLFKNGIAFTAVSATTIDAGLLFLDNAGLVEVSGAWYINAPIGAWALVGIPVSIALAERLLHQINPRPGRITGFAAGEMPGARRTIPLNVQGNKSMLLAHAVRNIFSEPGPARIERSSRPAVWRVPLEKSDVLIREMELETFLKAASQRTKHQFSRNYWCETRRPALPRERYEAMMRLLTESGLISSRQRGASGRLLCAPRHALTYLKHESIFAVT